MALRLAIDAAGYTLADGAAPLAVLHGGASALLPAPGRVDAATLEAAIERAEDWLMPHAARLRGATLEVGDATGALAAGLREVLATEARALSTEALEDLFLRLVDLATGRVPAAALAGRQAFVAHVLLLRELAHHGRLAGIRLS